MKNFSAIGFEIAKQVFQVHGADDTSAPRELLVTQRMQASNALRAIRLNSAPCFRRCLW
jgi:hypothetical protein